ncbi:MAG: alpha-E domain-containing protein [Deltaproteobacteria bacterium]|nr:alpha-E domain-containing protein [Deltaproteobacteria bacterium]
MLSRVAQSLYWIARYIERAENVARFVDVNLQLLLDLPTAGAAQWEPLVSTTGDLALFRQRYKSPTRENVVSFLTFDPANPNSILSCLTAARENSRSIRETISSDMWEHVNEFYHRVNGISSQGGRLESPYQFFDSVKKGSYLFDGITLATLSHGESWYFYLLGRLLERADKTSRLLDFKYFVLLPSVGDVGTPFDDIQWAAVLRSASGFEMYRKRHAEIAPNRIAEFLMLDTDFPRSINYCVANADQSVHAITGTQRGMFRNPAERKLGQLRGELAYSQAEEIISKGLHEYLDRLQGELNLAGDAISATFFAI